MTEGLRSEEAQISCLKWRRTLRTELTSSSLLHQLLSKGLSGNHTLPVCLLPIMLLPLPYQVLLGTLP